MNIGEIILPDSFDGLSSSHVIHSERLLGALWSSADPTLDVRSGALLDLLLRPFATLLEVAKESFRTGAQQSDLNYLLSSGAEHIPPLLDALAKNYRISRKVGSGASGKLRLVFSRRVTVSVGPADRFGANGIEFVPLRQFTADAREGFMGGEVMFSPMPDDSGYVSFDVPVAAMVNGSAGNLTRGMEAVSVRGNIPHLVRAFAAETFTGGADDESNHDLVQRMLYGLSAKVLSSRINMKASLLDAFPEIRDSSIVGAGDEEMTRDKHTVFPGATGGYADWYVATTKQLQTATLEMDHGRFLSDLPEGSLYSLDILEKHFPGLYWVTGIVCGETNTPCDIQEQRKEIAPTDEESPRLHASAPEEAMFSAYQKTSITFWGPKNLQTLRVSGVHMPQIKEIQDWVLRCGQSPIGLDILVKGAVPVTVRMSAVLNTPVGTEIDLDLLQGRVANYVNSIPLGGVLSLSGIIALLHSSLPEGSYLSDEALFAAQWLSAMPTAFYVRDRLILNRLPFGTNRTCILYCDPAEITFDHKYIDGRC